jgi:CubicO group peptidase (beta-lactamase class C family)
MALALAGPLETSVLREARGLTADWRNAPSRDTKRQMGIFKTAVIVTALLAAPTLALGQAPAAPLPAPDQTTQVDRLFAAYPNLDTPGCAVSAAQDGRVLVERAYGSADLEHDVPITVATPFEAGSVAKQFTAAAILLLVQDGKVKLTDDVRKYLPQLPDYGRPITIDQLLSHTSGLRDWGDLAFWQGWPRTTRAFTQDDVVDLIRRQRGLNYLPGAEYAYTNSGYNLLTEVVRKASGQSLADFTAMRIFKPLGMTRTSWRTDFRRIVKGRAIAYGRSPDGWRQQMPFEEGYGNGGLITTVADLQTWNAALASQKLGDFLTVEMRRRASLNDGTRITYARGLVVQTWAGQEEISHSGSTGAYRAWLGYYPRQRLSVAVLCNASDANATVLGRGVALTVLPPAPPEPPGLPLASPTSRAGLYVNERTGRTLLLVADPAAGGGLRVAGAGPLWPLGGEAVRFGADELTFGKDSLTQKTFEGDRYLYRRTPLWLPTQAQLAPFIGRYRSDEIGVTYSVVRSVGGLVLKLEDRPTIIVPMKPVYRDAFDLRGNLARFRRDANGRIVTLSLGSGRVRDLRLRKIG